MNKLCAIQNIPHNTTTMILCVSDAHTHTHRERSTRTWNVTLFTIYFDIQNCTSFKRDDDDEMTMSRAEVIEKRVRCCAPGYTTRTK